MSEVSGRAPKRARYVFPFRYVECAAALSDAILIVTISVLSGILYREMIAGPPG